MVKYSKLKYEWHMNKHNAELLFCSSVLCLFICYSYLGSLYIDIRREKQLNSTTNVSIIRSEGNIEMYNIYTTKNIIQFKLTSVQQEPLTLTLIGSCYTLVSLNWIMFFVVYILYISIFPSDLMISLLRLKHLQSNLVVSFFVQRLRITHSESSFYWWGMPKDYFWTQLYIYIYIYIFITRMKLRYYPTPCFM